MTTTHFNTKDRILGGAEDAVLGVEVGRGHAWSPLVGTVEEWPRGV